MASLWIRSSRIGSWAGFFTASPPGCGAPRSDRPEAPGDFGLRRQLGAASDLGGARRGQRPTQSFAVLPGVGQPSPSSFSQNLPFELSEDGQQTSHRATSRSRQIERLSQRYETDSEMLQFLKRRQQVRPDRPQRSSRHTSTTSISRRRAASISCSRACRCAASEPTSRTCSAIVQPRRAAYSRRARVCIAQSLLIVSGNAGIQPGTKHFRWPTSLAENVPRFWVADGLFGGHFERSDPYGRSRSFPARQDHHITRPRGWRAAPVSRGSSRASTPKDRPPVRARAAATQ